MMTNLSHLGMNVNEQNRGIQMLYYLKKYLHLLRMRSNDNVNGEHVDRVD